jgi:hypothetical protein
MKTDEQLLKNLIADVENICELNLRNSNKIALMRCFEITIGTHLKGLNKKEPDKDLTVKQQPWIPKNPAEQFLKDKGLERPIKISSEWTSELALSELLEQYHESRMKWISVNDILPKQASFVIACKSNGIICGMYYNADYEFMYGEVEQTSQITYWMPLPEPPKD